MGRRLRSLFLWLAFIALAASLFGLASQITHLRYENSDDSLLLKGFMGFEGGAPIPFSLYTNTLLSRTLALLSAIFPAIPWFSVIQLGVLLIICAALLQGFWRLSGKSPRGRFIGGFTGLLFFGVFALFACCRVTYTTTAALATGAALLQLLALAPAKPTLPALVRASLLPLTLLLCAYSLRASAALPGLAFCALALGAKAPSYKGKSRLSPWVPALMIALSIGALAGIRLLETQAPELSKTLAWHSARTKLMDYTPFEQNPIPALEAAEAAGLTRHQVALLGEWYFMDERITTEALSQLAAAYPQQTFPQRLATIPQTLAAFFSQNPRYVLAASLILGLCLLTLLLHPKGHRPMGHRPLKQPPSLPVAAVLGLLGGAFLLCYLAYQGRVLPRGVDTVLFPAAALESGLFLLSLRFAEGTQRPIGLAKRIAIAALCVVCLGAAAAHITLTHRAVSGKPDAVSLQREAELERFALKNPDKLILRTPNLLRDTRLFPDVSAGIPANIILWGDWSCRTPSWYAQLRQYGIDGEAFVPTDWLRPEVLFACVYGEAPPSTLLAHIGEAADGTVTATQVGEEGSLAFFAFSLAP